MKLLIDADIITFRSAFSAEDEEEVWVACSRADIMIREICLNLNEPDTNVELWLSGKNNFRYGVYPEYKANRLNAKRPKWEQQVKDYLVHYWHAQWSEGCEADDMLGVRQMQLKEHNDGVFVSTICTTDKDLDQIPGPHYNFVKKELYNVTPEEAIRFFYYQCLVGDTADGIKGVPNIGPVKAKKLLDACDEEARSMGVDAERLYYECVKDKFSCYEEFVMNAKVLHIWHKEGGVWTDKYYKEALDTSEEESLHYLGATERH